MSVKPQAVVGDPVTGFGAEPIKASLTKYNNHTHTTANLNNFLAYGIKYNDLVEAESQCGDPVVPENTTVVDIKVSQLTLSNPAIATSVCNLSVGGKVVYNCSITENSLVVTFASVPDAGLVTKNQLTHIATKTYTVSLYNPAVGTLSPFVLHSNLKGYIQNAYVLLQSGQVTCSLEFRSNTNTIRRIELLNSSTASSLPVHVDLTHQSELFSSYVNVGDSLFLNIEAVDVSTVLYATVEFIPDLSD